MAGISIRKNDFVVVKAGKEKGKKGKVLKVLRDKDKVVVEKVNFIKRHQRPTSAQRQGGIIEREGPVHLSNVMLWCEKCGKGVRVRRQRLDDGKVVRLCAGCGESFD
ncbi:MAG: 50S ribosomal protein L24 [bacterium]|nr:MAG: 50S ribosomal protein L24 [bacterium]